MFVESSDKCLYSCEYVGIRCCGSLVITLVLTFLAMGLVEFGLLEGESGRVLFVELVSITSVSVEVSISIVSLISVSAFSIEL